MSNNASSRRDGGSEWKRILRRGLTGAVRWSVVAILVVGIAEGCAALLLDNPTLLKGPLLTVFRSYYQRYEETWIQMMPECAHYDARVTYRLKRGHCRFDAREFDGIDLTINRLGVRDDEASLLSPDVIVAGDSFAMGWGVPQHETFAQLIEQKTGLRVLNAAVSSYGTVREMAILEDVDKSKLQYLIIQYCDNDYRENKEYFTHNNRLPISSAAEYRRLAEEHLLSRRYRYGQYTFGLLIASARILAKQIANFVRPRNAAADEAAVFLNAVSTSTIDLAQTTVIVFEVNPPGKNSRNSRASLPNRKSRRARAKSIAARNTRGRT